MIAINNNCTYSTDIREIKLLQVFAVFSKYFLFGMLAILKPVSRHEEIRPIEKTLIIAYHRIPELFRVDLKKISKIIESNH